MTTIPPPKDDGMTLDIPFTDEIASFTKEHYELIKSRLGLPPWKCPSCGLTNYYYNERCADYKCRHIKT